MVLPKSIKKIDNNAFVNCPGLLGVVIPDSVAEIGTGAFGFTNTTDDPAKRYKIDGFTIYGKAAEAKNYAKFYGFKCFDFLAGDANGDTKVNMKDLVLLQRHLNGWGVEIDLTVCDLTGDKKVNMKDFVALQRQLNGWT